MKLDETLPTGEVKAVESAAAEEAIEKAAQEQELRRRRAVRDDVCPVCGDVHEPHAHELDASTA